MSKRKRSGCVHEQNDVIVESLRVMCSKLRESSHLVANYKRAIYSIQQHPQAIENGNDAKQLKNIGNYIANQIQAILTKHRLINSGNLGNADTPPSDSLSQGQTNNTLQESVKDYAPAHRKQPWYVLVALNQLDAITNENAIALDVLLRKMQAIGYDGTMVKLRGCLAGLSGTHRVIKKSAHGGVYLTARGRRSVELCPSRPQESPLLESPSPSSIPTCPSDIVIELSDSDSEVPSSFDHQSDDEWEIVLILDHREILSRRNRDILERKLLERQVTCEVRALAIGDVQWIARQYRQHKIINEYMMNVIVERKEVKDFVGSIIDRRYCEQKSRLRETGIHHVIYLVEGSFATTHTIHASVLQTAMCRTQVQDQFFVQYCQNADESVAFLHGVYSRLIARIPQEIRCRNRLSRPNIPVTCKVMERWQQQQFCSPLIHFTTFNEQFRKKMDFTVGEIYQMMLTQVPGLSPTRIIELVQHYKTFQQLYVAIKQETIRKEMSELRYGTCQRRFGMKIPDFLWHLCHSIDYETQEIRE